MEGQEVTKPKKTRAKYEVIIILVVIIATAIVALGIYKKRGEAEKGNLMIAELEQMRSAVTTYKMLNKSNPPDLASLVKMTYKFAPGEPARHYLSNIPANKKGNLVDPFGKPYDYDPATGWVHSMSKGYEKW